MSSEKKTKLAENIMLKYAQYLNDHHTFSQMEKKEEASKRACIWCHQEYLRQGKKKYCEECNEKCVRECIRCRRPFPDLKWFETENSVRCMTCEGAYQKEKLRRQENKLTKQNDGADDNDNGDEEIIVIDEEETGEAEAGGGEESGSEESGGEEVEAARADGADERVAAAADLESMMDRDDESLDLSPGDPPLVPIPAPAPDLESMMDQEVPDLPPPPPLVPPRRVLPQQVSATAAAHPCLNLDQHIAQSQVKRVVQPKRKADPTVLKQSLEKAFSKPTAGAVKKKEKKMTKKEIEAELWRYMKLSKENKLNLGINISLQL